MDFITSTRFLANLADTPQRVLKIVIVPPATLNHAGSIIMGCNSLTKQQERFAFTRIIHERPKNLSISFLLAVRFTTDEGNLGRIQYQTAVEGDLGKSGRGSN
jgi:hypothetical protein